MLYLNITLSRDWMISKALNFFHRLTHHRWQIAGPQTMDVLQLEIHRVEQTISDMGTKPNRAVRDKYKPPPTISEHQKIIDLAG